MKFIVVGDVHCKESDIPECEGLIEFVKDKIVEHEADACIFLGDQGHHHGIGYGTVLSFWKRTFIEISKMCDVIALVGNHDFGDDIQHNFMSLLDQFHKVRIIDSPYVFKDILFLPFYRDNNKFIEKCNEYPTSTLFCHQTFQGSRYENQFYAKDGIDISSIPQKAIISGHIHMPQEIGKCAYVGSPRWLTISDANQDRFLCVIETDEDGKILSKVMVLTSKVCQPFYSEIDTKEQPFIPGSKHSYGKTTVDIHGTVGYVNKRKEYLESMGFRVRTFAEKNFESGVKESDGIRTSFVKFIKGYTAKYRTPSDELLKTVEERITWMRL